MTAYSDPGIAPRSNGYTASRPKPSRPAMATAKPKPKNRGLLPMGMPKKEG